MRHVIIGAGPAGVIAAEQIRRHDPESTVTLVGEEPEPSYSRMAIPYLLIGQIEENGTYLRKNADHFDRMCIEVRHDRVTGVTALDRQVALAEGGTLDYDKLLIATGSSPVKPPIPGIESDGVHHCWTLNDARNIIRRSQSGNRVVLIGAGFIGCIILEALVESGAELTVVEMDNRMVPRMMNEAAGGLIKAWCENKGITVHTSTSAEAIEASSGTELQVTLSNGQSITSDLVVLATGVRPNIAFLNGSGIETDHGILVDEYLSASNADVFAAGDVCQGKDFSTGGYTVQAIQPTAADHGRIAAGNMTGNIQRHQGSVNMNVLNTMGLVSSSFGLWMGVNGGDSAEASDADNFKYLNLQFQDDMLVGASSLGLTDHVGVLRGLIQGKIKLGQWKQKLKADPTRLMEAYLANTQAVGFNAHVS